MSSRMVLRLALALVVLLGLWWLWGWFRSPQRQIYRRLDALVEQVEKRGEEGSLPAAAAARGVTDFFAPGFLVRARPYSGELRDPQELAGAVMQFRVPAKRIAIDVSSRQLTLAPDARTGELAFVAAVSLDRGRGSGRESWRVRSLWILDRDEWRISELELVERLEGSGVLGF